MDVVSRTWTWLATGSHWSGPDGVWHRLAEHLQLTVVCLALSCAIALPLAVVLGHTGRGGALAVNLSNAGRAVPTFAVLVLLTLGPLGTYDSWPTIIALVLFAIPPLLTNAYVGMREVDRDVVEAARGMGMSGRQVIGRVELPLAMPLVMTGVRSAAVQVVATVSIAAIVGGGGLGRIITAGFRLTDTPQVVAGAVLVAALALVVEGAFVLLERRLGRRRRGAAGADRISDASATADTAPTAGRAA
ncbi:MULTISPECIES: ABC transporter permease [Streptomyces]|uniref:ABC transporter permease n=1 Tax=Streptomyces TaxID=1883 RepID=UPI00163C59A2|nr:MULTISPECIES: ABC transporter permease [Streptomyces]MBC2875680.1 ABC transporter permease [Streptomyces sp. TYQ1024]UBI37538.1 ABC transporter permease [Streptomyces mobaraensis]UKW30127.1 ABC transporter permease [Streptomyces sp. TYQ1024]